VSTLDLEPMITKSRETYQGLGPEDTEMIGECGLVAREMQGLVVHGTPMADV